MLRSGGRSVSLILHLDSQRGKAWRVSTLVKVRRDVNQAQAGQNTFCLKLRLSGMKDLLFKLI